MSQIRTLVYFDLEATGLRCSGRPRITELSFVAVNTEDVLDMHSRIFSNCQENRTKIESIVPRIVNKLTVCVYPLAIIRPEVTDITGLDNYNLSGQASFSMETGELLNSFLAILPKPLCLVAHNGNQFDFPLLKAELDKAGSNLPVGTLCVDSYTAMKQILSGPKNIQQLVIETETHKTPKQSLTLKDGSHEILNSKKVASKATQYLPKFEDTASREDKRRKLSNLITRQTQKEQGPKSYSLINLHTHLLGCPPAQSHGSEADCLSLLRTTAVLGTEWVQWVRDNSIPFSNCKRMWSYN